MALLRLVARGHDSVYGDVFNVYHFDTSIAPVDIANGLVTYFYSPMAGYQTVNFQLTDFLYYTWTGPTSGEWYDTVGSKKVPKKNPPWGVGTTLTPGGLPVVGTELASTALPAQVAVYIYQKTSVPRDIGKKYFGSLAEGALEDGTIEPTLKTHLETMTLHLDGSWAGMKVWGPIHGFQSITSATVGLYFGTQRRRKPGVGK